MFSLIKFSELKNLFALVIKFHFIYTNSYIAKAGDQSLYSICDKQLCKRTCAKSHSERDLRDLTSSFRMQYSVALQNALEWAATH